MPDPFSVFMEHVADVYSSASGVDPGGGTTIVYAVRAAAQNFILNASPAGQQERFDQTQLIGPITGATYHTGVQRGDLLQVTAGPSLVGARLKVTAIKDQPGVSFLGIDELFHITCEHLL